MLLVLGNWPLLKPISALLTSGSMCRAFLWNMARFLPIAEMLTACRKFFSNQRVGSVYVMLVSLSFT